MVKAHIYFEKWEIETIEQAEERAIEVIESRFHDIDYSVSISVNDDTDFEEIKVLIEADTDNKNFNALTSQLNTQVYN